MKLKVPATACGKTETVPEVEPLTNKDEDDILVNAPVLGVVDPIVPGISNVLPFRVLEFKLATLVVLDTIKGAVPVAILLTRYVPVMNDPQLILPPTPSPPVALLKINDPVLAEVELTDPLIVKVVACARPKIGLESVGELLKKIGRASCRERV